MFIIFGWGRQTIRFIGYTAIRLCSDCGNASPWSVAHIRRWFTIFFIPVIPYESRYVAMCPVCRRGFELDAQEAQRLTAGGTAPADSKVLPEEQSVGSASQSRELPLAMPATAGVSAASLAASNASRDPLAPKKRRRWLWAAAIALVVVAGLAVMGVTEGGHSSPGTPATTNSATDARQPQQGDLQVLVGEINAFAKESNRLTVKEYASPSQRRVAVTRFASFASAIRAWSDKFPGASPSTQTVCSCAEAAALAESAFVKQPSAQNLKRYEQTRKALNAAADSWNINDALTGQ